MLTNLSIKKRNLFSKKMLKYKICLMKLTKSNRLSEKIITLPMALCLEIQIQLENYKGKKVFRLLNLEAKTKTKRKIQKEVLDNKPNDEMSKENINKFTDFSYFSH